MTKAILIFAGLLVLLLGIDQALALYTCKPFSAYDAKKTLQVVENDKALRTSNTEKNMKKDFIKMKLKTPAKFESELKNIEIGDLHKGYLREINEAAQEISRKKGKLNEKTFKFDTFKNTSINKAKAVAKRVFMDVIAAHWSRLQQSIFNDVDVERWVAAREIMAQRLQSHMSFAPAQANEKNNYHFVFNELGFVEVDKSALNKGKWCLTVDTRLDNNRLVEGADKIRSSGEGDQDTVVATSSGEEEDLQQEPTQKPAAGGSGTSGSGPAGPATGKVTTSEEEAEDKFDDEEIEEEE